MHDELELYCDTVEQLPATVDRIYEFGKDFRIWLLKGEMGAGKTTVIHTLTDRIGTLDHVSSPSYSIVHEYVMNDGKKVFHFDFFRTRSVAEIFDIGIDEYIDSGHLCLMEWPELLEPYLEDKYLSIRIFNPEEEKRIFIVKKHE